LRIALGRSRLRVKAKCPHLCPQVANDDRLDLRRYEQGGWRRRPPQGSHRLN
jgi:hypothetical protein